MAAILSGVVAAAIAHRLDPELVEAVCLVESGGNPFAWNPEPAWRYFWNVRTGRPFRAVTAAELAAERPPTDFHALAGAGDADQEWWGQQASWGLMQVMGAVAREFGFADPYLPKLTVPEVGLEYGCRVLAERLRWAGGDVRAAVAAYNGGKGGNAAGGPLRNAAYADKVEQQLAALRRHVNA
ncbi:MAG: transglycosylase SLT domain-containing protein [Vicinamibacterales bacterium]